jgi:CO/xanthine dehydrogenase Mo-binding subunit
MSHIMSDIMSHPRTEPSFSRRDLLKGGGALVIGFCLAGTPKLARAAASPDPTLIDTWIAVHADNTATVIFGKGEFGQGNLTGMLQIAGEELDLDIGQLAAVRLDTSVTPDQGATTSSSSIERGGPQLRAAAAEARQALLRLASARLDAPVAALTVSSRRQAVRPEAHRQRAAQAGEPVQAGRHAGAAPRSPRQGERPIHPHAACARARHAARPHRAPARAGPLWQRRQGGEHRRKLDQGHRGRPHGAQG